MMDSEKQRIVDVPFLSIIIPAYNVEQYLEQCVDSVLKQDFKDFEVLLVDDGSTDSTGQLCDNYVAKDERVRVIHKRNGGLVSARKAGIKEAKGRYIGYVDGDDWISGDMYEKMCHQAEKEGADIVICDFFSAYREKNTPMTHNMNGGVFERDELESKIYPSMLCKGQYFSFGFYPALWCKIFRKEVIEANQLNVEERIKLGEDAACFYEAMLDARKVVYLKGEYCYYYRMRSSSISHSMVKEFYTNDIFLLLEGMNQEFQTREKWLKVLLPQLNLYACYMLDNMLTPHLRFNELFLKKNLQKELLKIKKHPIGSKVIQFGKECRISSRMNRVLKTIDNSSFANRFNLYLFVMYERLYAKRQKSIATKRKIGNE